MRDGPLICSFSDISGAHYVLEWHRILSLQLRAVWLGG